MGDEWFGKGNHSPLPLEGNVYAVGRLRKLYPQPHLPGRKGVRMKGAPNSGHLHVEPWHAIPTVNRKVRDPGWLSAVWGTSQHFTSIH